MCPAVGECVACLERETSGAGAGEYWEEERPMDSNMEELNTYSKLSLFPPASHVQYIGGLILVIFILGVFTIFVIMFGYFYFKMWL